VPSPAHLFINDFLPGASIGYHAPIWATPRLGRSADYYINPVKRDAVEIESRSSDILCWVAHCWERNLRTPGASKADVSRARLKSVSRSVAIGVLQAMPTQIKAIPLAAARATRAMGMFAARGRGGHPLNCLARKPALEWLRAGWQSRSDSRSASPLVSVNSEAAIESSPLTERHSPITVTPATRLGCSATFA
jgi:hypothetical protein